MNLFAMSPARIWLRLLVALVLSEVSHQRPDSLALLSGTLRIYQRKGCEERPLTLRCPKGTSISVQSAQFGKPAPEQTPCGPRPPDEAKEQPCLWSSAMQYSLLQTVVEACQKRRQCKFRAAAKALAEDPCPSRTRIVSVEYKCRPAEFVSRVACEGETMQLACEPRHRIAVYSASFGRTEYESVRCPQFQKAQEETCLVSYATETAMQICHGKRRCSVPADSATFGSPCRPKSRLYLRLIYTCVPRLVLQEKYEGTPEGDEDPDPEDDLDWDGSDFGSEASPTLASSPQPVPGREWKVKTTPAGPNSVVGVEHKRPTVRPLAEVLQRDDTSNELVVDGKNCTIVVAAEKSRVIGFISEWVNAYTFMARNQERLYLYAGVSLAGGLIACLALLSTRLWLRARRERRDAERRNAALPSAFTDDLISEVDADIEPPTATAEVVRFGPRDWQPDQYYG